MPSARSASLLIALALAAAYIAAVGSSLSRAYIDLGDGNYLYTSSRMADGLALYRDFLSPQPPMHLLTGDALIRLGRALGEPVLTVRVFSMALRLATMALVFLLGWRIARNPFGGALAAAVFLFLPIGFWWSLGYQSELQEIFWLLLALLFLLPLRRAGAAGAGAAMALAVLTNMTAAPYALAIALYLGVRHPRRLFGWYLLPLVLIVGGAAAYYEARTGAFFQNVVWNQVGAYPKEGLVGYALGKLSSQGSKILFREGGFILLSLLGLILYNRRETRPEREFLVWYALTLLLSAAYVTKGGTADYIFSIGEPVVALFSAYFLIWLFEQARLLSAKREAFLRDTSAVPQALFVLLALLVLCFPGILFISETLRQKTFEQSAEESGKVEYFIRKHSKPGDRILAPPYYAFAANRLLVEEYSELYLWSLKYSLERQEGAEGEGVRKVQSIAKELEARAVPVVVANVSPANPLILRSPEIRGAVDRYYRPLLKPEQRFRTLSADLQIFVPKTDAELAESEAAAPGPVQP